MTKNTRAISSLVSAALCLALALVLPLLTGQIPEIGSALCPMHIPALLCGFVCGAPWGLAVGFIAPLLRYLIFGMPPIFPMGLSMAFELAAYGFIAGFVSGRLESRPRSIYISLISAMLGGRLVWGLARYIFAGLSGSSFPFSMFLAGAITTAIPGIVVQLVVIPLLVMALEKARLIHRK